MIIILSDRSYYICYIIPGPFLYVFICLFILKRAREQSISAVPKKGETNTHHTH